jgi:hypothetical protein
MKQKYHIQTKALAALTMLAATTVLAQNVAYQAPSGGWAYSYLGSAAAYGTAGSFSSLDGSWNRGLPGDSDSWDGSGLGGSYGLGNMPGGIEIGTEGGTTFMRLQDPGDPRNNTMVPAWVDPSNRKIALGHDLAGFSDSFIDSGVTISFRTRVPTSGMDTLWARNGATSATANIAYPTAGDGITYFGEGLGAFSLKEKGPTATTFGFGLVTSYDASFSGGAFTGGGLMVTDGGGGEFAVVPIADPTVWHEFWINIVADGSVIGKTHKVSIYMDGSYTPTELHVAQGDNSLDYNAYNWMGMGHGTTGAPGLGSGADDVDFFSVYNGVITPVPEPTVMGFMGLGLLTLAARFRHNRRN